MKKKFPWVIYLLFLLAIVGFAVAPFVSVIIASSIANGHGCLLDEGSVHPCIVAGKDRGELLYAMAVLGWLMLFTLPAGAVAGLIWLTALIVHRIAWRRRGAAPT